MKTDLQTRPDPRIGIVRDEVAWPPDGGHRLFPARENLRYSLHEAATDEVHLLRCNFLLRVDEFVWRPDSKAIAILEKLPQHTAGVVALPGGEARSGRSMAPS